MFSLPKDEIIGPLILLAQTGQSLKLSFGLDNLTMSPRRPGRRKEAEACEGGVPTEESFHSGAEMTSLDLNDHEMGWNNESDAMSYTESYVNLALPVLNELEKLMHSS